MQCNVDELYINLLQIFCTTEINSKTSQTDSWVRLCTIRGICLRHNHLGIPRSVSFFSAAPNICMRIGSIQVPVPAFRFEYCFLALP